MLKLSALTKHSIVSMLAILTVMPLLISPRQAVADHSDHWHHHDYRHAPRHSYGASRYQNRGYLHHRGSFRHHRYFYRRAPHGFVSLAAPFGAIVATLPFGFFELHIGGIRYFTANGIYYRPVPAGYEIVRAPTQLSEPTPVVQPGRGEEQQIVVQPLALNVRSGPGPLFSVVGVLHQDDVVSVRGDAPGWYYVRLPTGEHGWIMGKYTAAADAVPQG